MKHYMTISDASKVLQITPERVRQLIGTKKLEAVKFANRWFVSAKSVKTRKETMSNNHNSIYLAIPHELPPYLVDSEWAIKNPPVIGDDSREDDSFWDGDHDLHSSYSFSSAAEFALWAKNYKGHQWVAIQELAQV